MAIKASNQITITEHKKISTIKEWYLATSDSKDVTKETSGWTETVQTMDSTKKYLWNYEEVVYSIGDSDISDPVIIGVYGEVGTPGASLQIKYISSATTPTITNNDVNGWSDSVPQPAGGEKVYMTQKLSTDTNWSTPIQISGTDGRDGSASVEIDDNGYWVINGESTGVKAEGSDGTSPEITIGTNGNWFINGTDSGTKAQGEAGKDGSDIEYVYYISQNANDNLSAPSYTGTSLTTGWSASPQGITEDYKYEYVSVRTKPSGINQEWSDFSKPVIWSKWGEKGQDGDGVEYKYYLSNSSTLPTYSSTDSNWTDDPTGVSSSKQYEYVIQIRTINGVSTPASKASLWAKFGKDGKGIASVSNYYATTKTADETPSSWSNFVPQLTTTDKYLWNYEQIYYTDGSWQKTASAIIGVYGDSGTDAVDFQIYSTDGFEFSDSVKSIELKTVCFYGREKIDEGDLTYTWKWYDDQQNQYINIESDDVNASSITVEENDIYAFTSLKCEVIYDDITYEDYISLTRHYPVYTAVAKFFDGNNVIESDATHSIVYIELYKDNVKVAGLESNYIHTDAMNRLYDSNGVLCIRTPLEKNTGGRQYFLCVDGRSNGDDSTVVVLGKCHKSLGWIVPTDEYRYVNSFNDLSCPILYVPKEKINKSLNIDFTVYDNAGKAIAITNTTILDFNDPVVSTSAPSNQKNGQMWLDTSSNPAILKVWDGSKWANSSYQKGNVVHTSKPSSYAKGDLWILATGETCGDLGPGSMVRAKQGSTTFDASHWEDVDAEGTTQKQNIKQYFDFTAANGLKIGQSDDKFYVNITSTEMGFYDASDGNAEKVVSISNNSAKIKDMVVDNGAKFNCEVRIGNFVFKQEQNGSFSLALA